MTTTIPPRIPSNIPPEILPQWELPATEPMVIVTDPPETTTDRGGTTVEIPQRTHLPGYDSIPEPGFLVSPASKNVVGGAGGAVFGIGGGGDAAAGGSMAGIGAITVLLIVYDLVAWGFLVGALWKGLIDWKGNVKQQQRRRADVAISNVDADEGEADDEADDD